jgi:hypothetical protein
VLQDLEWRILCALEHGSWSHEVSGPAQERARRWCITCITMANIRAAHWAEIGRSKQTAGAGRRKADVESQMLVIVNVCVYVKPVSQPPCVHEEIFTPPGRQLT